MRQAELARELGVSKAYISMVLRGIKKPSKRVAEKLQKAHLISTGEARRLYPKSCSSASSDTSPLSELLAIYVHIGFLARRLIRVSVGTVGGACVRGVFVGSGGS